MKRISYESLFIALFAVVLLYNFHRYIFMYNDSGTSPTYSDTPTVWKVAKYGIIGAILIVLYLQSKFYWYKGFTINVLYIFLFWTLCINLIWAGNGVPNTWDLTYLAWFIILVPIIYLSEDIKYQLSTFFERYFEIITIVTILSDVYVIGNFYLTGRLTALAYGEEYIRFGGLWDDPNGYGLFCSFLAYCALEKKKWVLFALLVLCVYYTISFSAYFNLSIAICLWGIHGFKVRKHLKYVLIAGGLITFVALILYAEPITDYLTTTLSQKQGSMEEHAKMNFSFSLFPYFEHIYVFHETWYIGFFYNYTPLSPIFIALIAWYVYKLIIRKDKSYAEVYMILFLIEACFIPVMVVFPLNLIFLIFFYTVEARDQPVQLLTAYV